MTSSPIPIPAASGWRGTTDLADPATRAQLAALVDARADELADLFYDTMLADPQAGPMLDHRVVNQRLHASMARWCRTLFDPAVPLADQLALQQRTGEVHARIGVPMALVSRGARLLKRALCRHLAQTDLSRPQLLDACQYVHELVDLAIETMATAFDASANRLARSDEAFRLFFIGQNMKAERERRRSELLEWAHQILVRYYWDEQAVPAGLAGSDFSQSQFGLWLHHKAAMLFEGATELPRIESLIHQVEHELLPRLSQARANRGDARTVVTALNQGVDEIKSLLGTMFDRFIEVEDGRDNITQLLSRRYFPSVAKREIALAMREQGGFALLMIDIDHFRTIGQTLGPESGDLVLTQVADTLTDSVRAGDFVFRVGDDQFLLLLVEATRETLVTVAESLRQRIAGLKLRTASAAGTSVTVSIGMALFDGHPDYQRLVDRAEEALRLAKQGGRNRCHLIG